jgi:multicomponent K+:H+ antiporter subunit E
MTLLRKLVPSPWLSALLLVVWLVLARATRVADVALGLVLALAVPMLLPRLRIRIAQVRHPLVVARYVLTVAHDVVQSNFAVGRDLLRWNRRRPAYAFVVVPLDLREPVGLAVLAMVTTIVPGTVWSELALDRSAMLLHVWHVPDESAFVARFKARYEQPLREIFE